MEKSVRVCISADSVTCSPCYSACPELKNSRTRRTRRTQNGLSRIWAHSSHSEVSSVQAVLNTRTSSLRKKCCSTNHMYNKNTRAFVGWCATFAPVRSLSPFLHKNRKTLSQSKIMLLKSERISQNFAIGLLCSTVSCCHC
jgi:hypothetical protein